MGILTAKLFGKPILLSTDAIDFGSAARSVWKMMLKRKFLSFLYSKIADAVLVPSTASKQFVHSLGIPERNIFVTPYVVDNESISAAAQKTDRTKTRAQWKIPKDALVVLFCGKFLPRKRPLDLLRAFSIANMANSYLVLVGDGPLWSDLNSEVQQLGLASRVRFLGLVDYSKLPEVYASSNILIHPAENEPYGLIVNEAMVCGLPVIVSDRVGAGLDLIKNGITGFTYPCGDINALVDILRRSLSDRDGLKDMGRAAQHRMERWSPRENAETTAHAIERVTNLKRK
jgi:glycosyltransferase involved in cell wall biosynthesis